MTTITQREKEDFWIILYLNRQSDLIEGSIERAYLDFARTQHGIKNVNKQNHQEVKQFLKGIIIELQERKFGDQNEFDDWHYEKCILLKEEYLKLKNYRLTIGQAQKWINMTLKYLFALGEDRVKGIITNYQFFHIPIDNIIQEKLSNKIKKITICWSRIDNYSIYIDYQKQVRDCYHNEIPMDVEFRSWMWFNKPQTLME